MNNENDKGVQLAFANNFQEGMQLRDYFAAAALPLAYKFWMEDYYHPDGAAVAEGDHRQDEARMSFADLKTTIALQAYYMADAMTKAREEC